MEGGYIEGAGLISSDDPARYRPDVEHRRSFLSLRWLLIILAGYLTIFTHIEEPPFSMVFVLALVFAASNAAVSLIPVSRFNQRSTRQTILIADLVIVVVTLYLLRIPEGYLYLGFILIFAIAVAWRELRVVLFSLFVVSLLFGTFNYFRVARFELIPDIEQFLTLSLFFVVAIFYVFLCEQLRHAADLSIEVIEEKRNAEAMVEITRALASTLKVQDVLMAIVDRARDVLGAEECLVVGIDGQSVKAQVMVRTSRPQERNVDIEIDELPDLQESYRKRQMICRGTPAGAVINVPMITQDVVLGVIHVRSGKMQDRLSDSQARFFEVMASTAANTLRNAQLFEEVEQRARTDFLTGLSNYRFFQSTLATELTRAQRHNHPLSLLMIDLDYLKAVNDRFGHPSGDMVIRTIAETIRTSCRDIDFPARYGGEEFAVILPETPFLNAIQVADRVRDRIGQVSFGEIGSITASVGVANYPVNALSREDLIRVADQALYVAKNGGRDRVAYFDYQLITK